MPQPAIVDDLLAALEGRDLSPLELRLLLRLADGEATPSALGDFLHAEIAPNTGVIRRLDMRGLIRRRFEDGPRPRFVFSITPAGLLVLAPLVDAG
jgi:DNA-binding MarR family transcriptional regulator